MIAKILNLRLFKDKVLVFINCKAYINCYAKN